MNKHLLIGILALATLPAMGGLIYSSGDVNGSGTSLNTAIPDANATGVAFNLNVSGAGSSLSGLTVTLNVSGGYNGDLYAYLSCNGTLVTLLNRVGTGSGDAIQNTFGYATAGFNNVTLSDAGTGGNIHNVSNPGSLVAYTADGGSLASLYGGNPNGTWTLFFADLSGGNVSTLNGWSLDITAVPEPVNMAVGIFSALLGGGALAARWRRNVRLK